MASSMKAFFTAFLTQLPSREMEQDIYLQLYIYNYKINISLSRGYICNHCEKEGGGGGGVICQVGVVNGLLVRLP